MQHRAKPGIKSEVCRQILHNQGRRKKEGKEKRRNGKGGKGKWEKWGRNWRWNGKRGGTVT